MLDKVIAGGTVIGKNGLASESLGIKDGRIVGRYAPGNEPPGAEIVDAHGLAVLPGLVDVHSHHREPGFEYKEDISTVTRACAAGGVTTSVAMPNVSPPPTSVASLRDMLKRYDGRAFVDYNVNPAPTNPDEIVGLAAEGIIAFKVFMVTDTGRDYPHMPGIGVHDSGRLMAIMEAVAATGIPLMVHPHDQELMGHIEGKFWEMGERDARAYAKAYAAHDGLVWDTAIALLLRLQEATGVPLHILHTQTWRSVDMLRSAKSRGRAVTAEINPWALFLGNDWDNIERLGSYALSYWVPEQHHEALWTGLRDGTIDIVSTDHAPHTQEEKERGWVDGWSAHTGTPSTQFYLSLLLDAAASGRLSLERVVDVACAAPAEMFGLTHKGHLDVGADADLVLVDLNREHTISEDEVLSKHKWTPYAGRTVRGRPVRTYLRGDCIYDETTGVTGEPKGRHARRCGVSAVR